MNRAVLPSLCKTPRGPDDWEAFAKWLQYTLCNAQKYGKCDESDPLKNGEENWAHTSEGWKGTCWSAK